MIGDRKADGVMVNVSEYFGLTRIYQDDDTIVLSDLQSLNELINKLQIAKMMIEDVKKATVQENVCYSCGCKNTEENPVRFQEDPYSAEIHDNHTMHWMCTNCSIQSSQDI